MKRKVPPKRIDLEFAGHKFTSGPEGTVIHRQTINTRAPGDYGADPMGDGTFRMVPSGDIVSLEERNRRMDERKRRLGYGNMASREDHELDLYMENDRAMYEQFKRPILRELQRRIDRGDYDAKKAASMWRLRYVLPGLERYNREASRSGWDKLTMSPAERTQLAEEIERHEHVRLKLGDYRELHERPKEKGPRCGHSVCSQHYIDTGDPKCIYKQRLGPRVD